MRIHNGGAEIPATDSTRLVSPPQDHTLLIGRQTRYNDDDPEPEAELTSMIVAGFVKNGVIVPNMPLPEGAFVEVHVIHGPIDVPPELQEEFDAWNRASAQSLETVERLAREGEGDAKG